MTNKINCYGLRRDPSAEVKKEIRKACGFGCVVCGNALFHYEHIEPEWHEAQEHDPSKMACLCGGCHDRVTRKVWSKQKIKIARARPYSLKKKQSLFSLDASAADLIVELKGVKFINTPNILVIDGEPILEIHAPEESGAPPSISAIFYDRNGDRVASIDRNEWIGEYDVFDIETTATRWKVRSKARKIDLELVLNPPNGIIIERCHMRRGSTEFKLYKGEVSILAGETKVGFPTDMIPPVRKSPAGILIEGEKVSICSDVPLNFNSPFPGPSKMSIKGGPINFIDLPESERPKLPPGMLRRPGSRPIRFEGNGSIQISLTNPWKGSSMNKTNVQQPDSDSDGKQMSKATAPPSEDVLGFTKLFGDILNKFEEPSSTGSPFANSFQLTDVGGAILFDFRFQATEAPLKSCVSKVVLEKRFALKFAKHLLNYLESLNASTADLAASKASDESNETESAE